MVRISKSWYYLMAMGLIVGIGGHLMFNGAVDEILEFIGFMEFIGALVCGLTGLIIKYLRKKKGLLH
ncbi:hypothetical protein JW886_07450 [Lactococcus taiwanensis]|uniref:Uncharacterized protein n=1 Tax=Lactococcus taiwanensis TaxID=1151742 RepID=A0AA45KFF4_9LACT|nr:hypothetical protein [Lactococcus taiwanensis]QSE76297.1 hypothetical protein JW886_07450 [Lactococcus taiwanensis]